MAKTIETIEVHHDGGHAEADQGFFSPDATMLVLTWITFFLLLGVLYKFAWKPILQALDDREAKLKKSIEDAEKLTQELAAMDATRKTMIDEVEAKSKEMLEQSRKAAVEASKHIQEKAKEEAKILLENARRDVKDELEKAQAQLRAESAQIAVELAGKLIEENLDDEKNRKLINKYIKEI